MPPMDKVVPALAGLGGATASTGAKVGFKVLGQAASAAYGAVAGTTKALGALSGALNSASQDLSKQKPGQQDSPTNVIYVNFGMAGSAGKQRVTGGGSLPPRKNVAKPQVSEKMPTEALLDTAVKYLTSIDKSLKAQLDFEKKSYEQQVRDERESIIEEKKSSFNFSDIKDRLSGLKSSAQDAGSTLATIAKVAAGLALAATLAASSLDTKQLEELKANLTAFQEKFSWLSEIPAGGLSGFLFGLLFGKGIGGRLKSGLKGGALGILTTAVADVIFSNASGGQISEDTKSILNISAAGAIGYMGYRGIKSGIATAGNLRTAQATMAQQAAGRSYYNPSNQRVQNLATGRMTATNTATGFLKSPRWQRFLNWLTNNGKRVLVNKIQQRIAIAVGTGAVAATGVGAAFGAIGFLLNLGFSLFLMYEIYQLWQQFTSQDEAEAAGVGDDAIAMELNQPADATRISGAPIASIAQQQSLPPIPADIEKILAALRTNESGGNYGENSAKKGSTASGAYQFLDGTWKERAAKAGVGTEYPRAYLAPPEIQDAVAAKWVQDILAMPGVNGDVSKVPLVWFTGNPEGNIDAYAQSVNAVTPSQVQAKFMQTYDGGKFAQSSYSPTGSGIASAVGSMATASLEKIGELFGGVGGGVVSPGVARRFTPPAAISTERINKDSMEVNNNIALGLNNSQKKDDAKNSTVPGVIPGVTQPMVSISAALDPNYKNIDIIRTYGNHFKKAAA
jgi:hypothetical protein